MGLILNRREKDTKCSFCSEIATRREGLIYLCVRHGNILDEIVENANRAPRRRPTRKNKRPRYDW